MRKGRSVQNSNSSRAFYLANLCAEDALMKLKDNLDYLGNESLIIDDDSCEILQVEGSGNSDRVVKTTGTVYNQIRKIKIEIAQVNPKMEITSWREVIDF